MIDITYPLFDGKLWILVNDPESSTNNCRDQWHSLNIQAHNQGKDNIIDGVAITVKTNPSDPDAEWIVLDGTVYDDGTFLVSRIEINGTRYVREETTTP